MVKDCNPIKADMNNYKPDKPSLYKFMRSSDEWKEANNRRMLYPKLPCKSENQDTINFLNKLFYK